MKKYLILYFTLLLILTIRFLGFDFSPPLPKEITITTFNKYGETFYTSSANNLRVAFNTEEPIVIGSVIQYAGAEYNQDYDSYTLRNVQITGQKESAGILIRQSFEGVRQNLLSRLEKLFPSNIYQLTAGMLTGARTEISSELREKLITAGIIHTVVISGFHVSLVTLFLINIFKPFGIKPAYVISVIGIIIYIGIAGFTIPAVRAGIMGFLITIARLVGEQKYAIYILLLTGYGMLLYNPAFITNLSFQLSFGATLGILLLAPVLDKIIPSALSDLTAVISAQLFILPIVAYHFNYVSIISPLTNLLTMWTIPLIVIFTAILLLTSIVSEGLAASLSFLAAIPAGYTLWVVDNLSELRFAKMDTNIKPVQVTSIYLLIALFYVQIRRVIDRPR